MRGSILLQCLSSGESIALDRLAARTGSSIQQLHKTSQWLIEIGVPLVRTSHDHLQLERTITPLNFNMIQPVVAKFDPVMAGRIEIFEEIDSTNQYLMSLPVAQLQHRQVCVAEYMSRGKGRQKKKWHGGAYENVMLSIAWRFQLAPHRLSGLSLAVAVMVVKSLQQMGNVPYQLKWPNDVLIDRHKLSGILIEIRETFAIVGIGINCHLTATDQAAIDQPTTSLNEHIARFVDRNQLIAALLKELSYGLDLFSSTGLEPFREDWMRLHAYQGQWLRSHVKPQQEGLALGIDQDGQLLLQMDNGQIVTVHAGELEVLLD